jgi:hypothetical protein
MLGKLPSLMQFVGIEVLSIMPFGCSSRTTHRKAEIDVRATTQIKPITFSAVGYMKKLKQEVTIPYCYLLRNSWLEQSPCHAVIPYRNRICFKTHDDEGANTIDNHFTNGQEVRSMTFMDTLDDS